MQSRQNLRFKILLTFLFPLCLYGQQIDQSYLQDLKEDSRGPYAAIKWFCEDGTRRDSKDPCPEPMKGWQHAIYKHKVETLANRHHLFLDQILTGTDTQDFWDSKNQNSRLKQYQITNFLFDADNGWILEKAKNYRGAKQIEDEKEWGQEFLEWAVSDDTRLVENFLLLKMAAIDIPHGEDTRTAQKVRAYSKLLAEEDESFMNVRIKIHNNPSAIDLKAVKEWESKKKKLSSKASEYLELLLDDLQLMYKPFEISDLEKFTLKLSSGDFTNSLKAKINFFKGAGPSLRAMEACDLLKYIRENISKERKNSARLDLLDLSNQLEEIAMQNMQTFPSETIADLREKICYLSDGIYGAGYLEKWEYKKIKDDLDWMQSDVIDIEGLDYFKYAANKLVMWSSQMIQSLYGEPVHLFGKFEPLAHGLVDDKVRSSLILPAGILIEKLNTLLGSHSSNGSQIMGRKNDAGIQSLNPGIAKGKLLVLANAGEDLDFEKSAIYAFDRPPTEMKPVAGILNVKEGNPISHVQLLARNLGIPNSLISSSILDKLKKYDGKEVFYAVSPGGTVVLKSEDDMSEIEQKLFSKSKEKKRITISTEKIVLHPDSLLDMSKINASFSGKWCGPKAANLGQLKQMFPKHVVDGLVIPFGIFKDHMDQMVPQQDYSYWSFLKMIFDKEREDLAAGFNKKEIESETLCWLTELRFMIEEMPLKKSLIDNLEGHFNDIFGKKIGDIPVFVRSDTNMEDLPQFTGAGLNLTLFNVLDRDKILNGIKKVWASPYTERSYQWRQQYLENPEDVYPSILIIPSVNVDRSGVIITKGVSRGTDEDISISFSRGVGGAVEGQSAESYVIYKNRYAELISPGRETKYRVIPPSGGSTFKYASFDNPVLSKSQLGSLYDMAQSIATKMDTVTKGNHAYDIELGIKDDFLWLFQVRPFVENKDALGSDYLRSLDPKVENITILMDTQNN